MSESFQVHIPEHCKSCPIIFPTLTEYTNREAELYLLRHSAQLTEYRDISEIQDRIRHLEPEVERLARQAFALRHRTLGCMGVKLAHVKLDDETIEQYDCQSPLQD